MKAAIGGLGAAAAASACCIGPVAFALMGAGALGASAVALERYRPWFVGIAVLLVGVAFHGAYRPISAASGCEDGGCASRSRRSARIFAWTTAVVAAVLIAFPYYIGWFV